MSLYNTPRETHREYFFLDIAAVKHSCALRVGLSWRKEGPTPSETAELTQKKKKTYCTKITNQIHTMCWAMLILGLLRHRFTFFTICTCNNKEKLSHAKDSSWRKITEQYYLRNRHRPGDLLVWLTRRWTVVYLIFKHRNLQFIMLIQNVTFVVSVAMGRVTECRWRIRVFATIKLSCLGTRCKGRPTLKYMYVYVYT